MTTLEVKQDGKIYVIKGCPENHNCMNGDKKRIMECVALSGNNCLCSRYEQALASCERVKCADQQQARDLVMRKSSMGKGKDGFYEPTIGIYSLPDVEWEVREVPIERGPSTFSHYEREAGKQLVTEFERLAILK